MGELSIKIKIGDREYPMKVLASEEAMIRQAGKAINEKLRRYREQFRIDDKQDLLAMVAFDSMVDKMHFNENKQDSDSNFSQKIADLKNLISDDLLNLNA
ncbi:MAG TPA: cell division protein ZapA [Cytophagales bacterium]|nr:cell division protein ZapA [Cytophagales bacterium]